MGAKNHSVDEWTLTLSRQTCLLRSQVGQARKNRQLHFMSEPQLPLVIRASNVGLFTSYGQIKKRDTNLRVPIQDWRTVKVTSLGKGTAETDVRLPLGFQAINQVKIYPVLTIE